VIFFVVVDGDGGGGDDDEKISSRLHACFFFLFFLFHSLEEELAFIENSVEKEGMIFNVQRKVHLRLGFMQVN
jgi:hypothetical protein